MIFGYARVSTVDQNLDRQVKELENYGCDKIFQEKRSGKNFDRPVYREMRSKMRFHDVLVVHDLYRFGRNKEEIRNEWKRLIDEEIDIVVLNMPILNTRQYKELPGAGQLVSDLVLTLLSWLAEDDRKRILQAQKEGIALAKQKGVYKGTEKKYHPEAKGKNKVIYDEIVRSLKNKEPVMSIHKRVGVARNTIYKIKRELNL